MNMQLTGSCPAAALPIAPAAMVAAGSGLYFSLLGSATCSTSGDRMSWWEGTRKGACCSHSLYSWEDRSQIAFASRSGPVPPELHAQLGVAPSCLCGLEWTQVADVAGSRPGLCTVMGGSMQPQGLWPVGHVAPATQMLDSPEP